MASRQGLSRLDTGPGLPSSRWFCPRALSPLTPGSPAGAFDRGYPTDTGFITFGRLATPDFA